MPSLPNTILIGAAKAGTTSLCSDLQHHPDIWMYPSKETRFFSARYDRGLDYYRSLFRPTGQKIVMEGSPDYATGRRAGRVADRIHAALPDVRLIYMVRDPIVRIESAYVQELANGRAPVEFSRAMHEWGLLQGSLYEQVYTIFTERFPESRIHVIFFEDYLADKPAVIRDLCRFLEIPDSASTMAERKPANTRAEKIVDPPVVKALRRMRGFETYKHLVPHRLKLALKRRVAAPIDAGIAWTPALRAEVTHRVRPDAARFLDRFGKPADFWPSCQPDDKRQS